MEEVYKAVYEEILQLLKSIAKGNINRINPWFVTSYFDKCVHITTISHDKEFDVYYANYLIIEGGSSDEPDYDSFCISDLPYSDMCRFLENLKAMGVHL